jgi:hypothetical protein
MKLLLIAPIIASIGFAQEAPAPPMTPAERAWQESMTNVKMIGSFTVGDGKELHDDAYLIEKITKVADGQWSFVAHIQYSGRDVKVTLKVPVQFAGDTPVINFIRQTVPGMGTYNAKVLFYGGGYAGTWGAGDHGGSMFGKIVKNDMPEDAPLRKPQQ